MPTSCNFTSIDWSILFHRLDYFADRSVPRSHRSNPVSFREPVSYVPYYGAITEKVQQTLLHRALCELPAVEGLVAKLIWKRPGYKGKRNVNSQRPSA
jgi:hypothetical protein